MTGALAVSLSFGWVFSGCENRVALISSIMEEIIPRLVSDAGFTVFSPSFHKFPPMDDEESGYTSSVIIGESLVDIHTWPERDCAHIRIFYCDYSQDNTEKKSKLFDFFKGAFEPQSITEMEVQKYFIR